MNHNSSRPPSTPTAAPTAICSTNSPPTWPNAPALRPPAASRLAISAIPTGSLAPDSPSRMVPLRPGDLALAQHREDHGRVGRRDRGGHQQRQVPAQPEGVVDEHAAAAAVRNVPSTPATAIGAAAARNRVQPMCRPPSNRMQISATVTSRSTGRCARARCSAGTASPRSRRRRAPAAGAGTLMRSVSRLDSTASRPTTAISSTSRANV